jgi:hypothetical protein
MEVTQRITPASIRIVVTSTKNDLYVAQLTVDQLEKAIQDFDLIWKRPRGNLKPLRDTEEKESDNASSQASE